MIKQLKSLLIVAVLTVMAACTTTGTIATNTFNDKIALGIQTVTAAHQEATALVLAGKLAPAKSAVYRQQLDTIHASLELARATYQTNPNEAQRLYDDALARFAKAKQGVTP